MPDQPNVIFIVSDQHNAKVLGYAAHPNAKTPHIDRLATEGVRFENAITQNPICTPSRVSFLSGQYPHNHGYYGLSGRSPGGLPNILGHFRHYGYTTAAFGKIHCPEYWIEDSTDAFHDSCGTSVGGRPEYVEALIQQSKTDDHFGFPEYGDLGYFTVDGHPGRQTFEESQEGWVAEKSIEFIEKATTQNKPFLIHVSFPRPHSSTTPAQEFWDLYDPESIVLPPNSDYDQSLKAPHFRKTVEYWRSTPWEVFEPRTYEAGRLRKLHGYLGAVSQVDRGVGVIADYVRSAGLSDNTIIIYTSDHGDYAAEHGIMEKAPGICSDAITRVPQVWWWPQHFKTGHVVSEIVELVDIVNTIATLAGMPLLETADGKDISHLLRGGTGEVHAIGVTEFSWSKSVRKGKYRLVFYPKEMFFEEYPQGFGELYDPEIDPWEMRNLYFDPQFQNVINELRADLFEWLVTTTRPGTVLGVNSEGDPVIENNQQVTRYLTTTNLDGKVHPNRLKTARTKNYL